MYFYNFLMMRVNRELGYMRRYVNFFKGYFVYLEISVGMGLDCKLYFYKLQRFIQDFVG